MANYTVARGALAAHRKTLIADTPDSVTFEDDIGLVEVLSDGAADLFVTADGRPATVDGNHCHRLPAGAPSSLEIAIALEQRADDTVVHLISSGTPKYSVTRIDR